MGNNIVMGSKFTPFSYQDLVEPLRHAETQHQQLENSLGDLSSKTAVFDNLLSQEADSKAYQIYKGYSSQVENASDTLAKQGINAANKQSLLQMKTAYNKNIVPIELAFTKKQKDIAAEQDLLTKDPTRVFRGGKRASETSIDDYLENPNLMFDSVSKDSIWKDVAASVAHLAKEEREGYTLGDKILGFNYGVSKQVGYTQQEIQQAIQDYNTNPEAMDPVLKNAVDNTLAKYGVSEQEFGSSYGDVVNSALLGLQTAIGSTENQILKDDKAEANYKEALLSARNAAKNTAGNVSQSAPEVSLFRPTQTISNTLGTEKVNNQTKDRELAVYLASDPTVFDPKASGEAPKKMVEELPKDSPYRSSGSFMPSYGDLSLTDSPIETTMEALYRGVRGETIAQKANKELERLKATYGGTSIEEVAQNIEKELAKSVKLNTDYAVVIDDNSLVRETIHSLATIRRGDTGIKKLTNTGISHEGISKEDLAKVLKGKDKELVAFGFSSSEVMPTMQIGEDAYVIDYDLFAVPKEVKDLAAQVKQIYNISLERNLTADELAYYENNYAFLREYMAPKMNLATKKNANGTTKTQNIAYQNLTDDMNQ